MTEIMTPEQFKKIRENVGSQWKMAKLLNMSQAQISNYENGNIEIPQSIANKMENYK